MSNKWVILVVSVLVLLVGGHAVLAAAPEKPNTQGPIVDLDFQDAEVLDIYQVLGQLAGWNVVADQSVKGKFSILLRSTPLSQALDLVAQSTGFGYSLMENTLVVVPAERLKSLAQRDFALLPVHHIALDTAKGLLEAGIPDLSIAVDQKQSSVLVNGTADQVRGAKEVLARYDVAPSGTEFDFVDQPIAEILRTLAKSAGLNVMVEGTIAGKLTIYLKDIPAREAINLVASRAGVIQEETSDSILILRPGSAKVPVAEPTDTRIFQLKYLQASMATELITAAFPNTEVRASQGGSLLVVRGPVSELTAVAAILAQQDFPTIRLVGVVQHETGLRALLEITGRSYIVHEGQSIDDLIVESITTKGVTVRRGERTQVVTAGGAVK